MKHNSLNQTGMPADIIGRRLSFSLTGFVLKHPYIVLVCLLGAVLFFGFEARHFRLDASAETLVLENDQDLKYARLVNSRYGGNDYLVLTFTPQGGPPLGPDVGRAGAAAGRPQESDDRRVRADDSRCAAAGESSDPPQGTGLRDAHAGVARCGQDAGPEGTAGKPSLPGPAGQPGLEDHDDSDHVPVRPALQHSRAAKKRSAREAGRGSADRRRAGRAQAGGPRNSPSTATSAADRTTRTSWPSARSWTGIVRTAPCSWAASA